MSGVKLSAISHDLELAWRASTTNDMITCLMVKLRSEVDVECPCCGSTLVVDANLKRVVSYREFERGDKPELGNAHQILTEEKSRREAIFEQSVAHEKSRSDSLSKRFEEALKQAKKEPIKRPTRDFDLD